MSSSTRKFNIGDRVEFVEDYSYQGAPKGSRGVVIGYSQSGNVNTRLDDGSRPAAASEYRLKLLPKIKVGQKVRIARKVNQEAGWDNSWTATMDHSIGHEGLVESVSYSGIRISGVGYGWPSGALEVVENVVDATKKTFAFRVGDRGKTRGGFSYEVIAIRPNSVQEVVSEIDGDGEVTIETHESDGSYYSACTEVSDYDLMPPTREIKLFLNVYEDGVHYGYESERRARTAALTSAAVVAHPVTIEIPA